jgi:hypothetical protein
MARKHLTSDEMIQVTKTWVDAQSKANQAIVLVDDLAGLLKRLQTAHDALTVALQPIINVELQKIIDQEAVLDLRHDAIIRGCWWFLTGMADMIGGDVGMAILALRDTLIPDGLSSQQKSYRGEAGQAELLGKRLTPEIKQQLDSILVGPAPAPVPLTTFINEWLTVGTQLGSLEDKKGTLQDAPSVTQGQAELNARNQWIRVVNAFVANGELAGLDDPTDALIFGPLRANEKAADQRARDAEKKAAEEKAAKEKAAKDKAAAAAAAAGGAVPTAPVTPAPTTP